MKVHPLNPRFARVSLLLIATSAVAAIASAEGLPRSTPEAEGMSSASLHALVDTLDRKIEGMHSVMVVRHGKVVAEGWWAPYAAEHNHVLYSLSKSFTSTAVGLAVAEGKLDVRDSVLKFFPDERPAEPDENLRAMRVRDLLTMATGHRNEPPRSPDTVSAASFLAHPVTHQPGTRFLYNTPATFMQSAIVQKVTGQTVLDYLKPRLFDPLGIEHPEWDTNFEGISLGGYGLRVRTEDIAKLGQLYLQKGQWNGRQLLPAEWVAQATSRQIPNGDNPDSDWAQGYGFQFWMCRHGAYRGDGAFGQYCVVMPEQDIVVAITSGVTNMQAVLNVIWEHVLPAVEHKTTVPDPDSAEKLRAKLAGLEMPTASGNASSPMANAVFSRLYVFPDNDRGIESLSIIPSDGAKSVALVLTRGGRESRIPCGYRTWQQGQAPFDAGPLARFPDEPVAGTFAWQADDTLLLKICAYETPFAATLQLQFSGDRMTLDARSNVAFGPTRHPQLTGQAPPSPGARTFDGSISREVLERYLARSISMEGLLNGRGDLEDNIRMLNSFPLRIKEVPDRPREAILEVGFVDSKRWYHANNPSTAVPHGLGDEDAIRAIWASHSRGAL